MEKINVIKVGGGIVENPDSLGQLLKDFSQLPGYKILVHGGGRSATKIATSLGMQSQMVGGRRITDEQMLRVVIMVYGGLVNKTVVAGLQSYGVNALGLTGADMDVIRSHKRPLKRVTMDDGTEQMVDFGFVGDIEHVDGKKLSSLILQNVVPVIAPLTHDGEGHILNTNADTIASEVARALAPHFDVTLTFCFEKPGVLLDAEDDNSVIRHITKEEFYHLTQNGVVSGGMIPKLENAFQAIHQGVKQVIITRADHIDGQGGTVIE